MKDCELAIILKLVNISRICEILKGVISHLSKKFLQFKKIDL